MARMKKVFGSHSQLAHVWAQQNQDEGKASRMFFIGTDIYSYGHHYLAARIHTVGQFGERKIALVRSDTYSVSTSKHLSEIRHSLRDLMDYFQVPDVENIRSEENFNHFNDQIVDAFSNALSNSKITSQRDIEWKIERLFDVVNEANKYFTLAGYDQVEIGQDTILLLREHLCERLERYNFLNTPEMRAKKEAEEEKREKRAAEKLVEGMKENIANWRAGIFTSLNSLRSMPYAILRVRNENVETSHGASVPLTHALRLLSLIESKQAREGERIGHFALNGAPSDNGIIRIGCHSIELSEAQTVLAPYRTQELREA